MPQRLLFGFTLLAGLSYLLRQWALFGELSDPFFVGLVFAGTAVLLLGIRRIHSHLQVRGPESFAFLSSNRDDAPLQAATKAEALRTRVFSPWGMAVVGVAYGSLLSLAPWLIPVWEGHADLRVLLSALLFAVNVVAGIGFFGLIVLTKASWEIAPEVQIDLWERDNPSTEFLRTTTHGAARIAGGYIGLCIASILFSPFPLQGLVLVYSAFAASIIVMAFILPELPLRDRIAEEKRRTLREINAELRREFSQVFEARQRGAGPPDLSRLREILQLRNQVEEVSTWPFGLRSANTAIAVVAMAMLPKVLEVILSLVW